MFVYFDFGVVLVEAEVAVVGAGGEGEDVEEVDVLGVVGQQEHQVVGLEVAEL